MTDKERTPALSHRWTPDYIALWGVALLSLLLNVIILRQLVIARAAARQAVDDAIGIIDQLEGTTISTNVKIDNTIVIETDLPINQSFPVEIKDSFPIDTVLAVPVDAGLLGRLNLSIPIKTTIPVDVTPTVTIDRTFHVKAPVPLNLDVPVQVSVGSTGLAPALDALKARLRTIADQLDASLLPGLSSPTPEVK